MPHLYCDVRKENEEVQKLLHNHMLQGLLREGRERGGSEWAASWDALQNLALQLNDKEDMVSVLQVVRAAAMAAVADLRRDAETKAVYGAANPLRKQYTVKRIAQLRPLAMPPTSDRPKKAAKK